MTGAGETDRPAFDPRHDARFQRGYQPGDGDSAVPARRSRAVDPPAAAPSRTALPAPGSPREGGGAGVRAEPLESAQVDDLDTLAAFDSDGFQDELEPSRWNPFIALLWVVGVVSVVGSVVLLYQSATFSYTASYGGNGPIPFGLLLQQISFSLSAPLLISGLLILAGLLFWHAWAWRARRRPAGS